MEGRATDAYSMALSLPTQSNRANKPEALFPTCWLWRQRIKCIKLTNVHWIITFYVTYPGHSWRQPVRRAHSRMFPSRVFEGTGTSYFPPLCIASSSEHMVPYLDRIVRNTQQCHCGNPAAYRPHWLGKLSRLEFSKILKSKFGLSH